MEVVNCRLKTIRSTHGSNPTSRNLSSDGYRFLDEDVNSVHSRQTTGNVLNTMRTSLGISRWWPFQDQQKLTSSVIWYARHASVDDFTGFFLQPAYYVAVRWFVLCVGARYSMLARDVSTKEKRRPPMSLRQVTSNRDPELPSVKRESVIYHLTFINSNI